MPSRKRIRKQTKMGSYTDRAIYELKQMNDGVKKQLKIGLNEMKVDFFSNLFKTTQKI